MNILKRTMCIAMLCMILLSTVPFASAANGNERYIDVYIVTGQSNAAGFSYIPSNIGMMDGQFTNGFKNVFYYGKALDFNASGEGDFTNKLINVKAGLGANSQMIGPELGMASVLNSRGQESVIIKYARGASYLAPDLSGSAAVDGTWTSPSYIEKEMGGKAGAKIGELYREFLATFKAGIQLLKNQGYTPRVKGIIWHQGEAESTSGCAYTSSYGTLLTYLIKDMRRDVSSIMGINVEDIPFVIAKLAKANDTDKNNVDSIRNQQQRIADEMKNVYICETKGYARRDAWHLNGEDMIALGQEFMNTLNMHDGAKKLSVSITGEGSVLGGGYHSVGTNVTISAIPGRGYCLKSAKIQSADGQLLDITEALQTSFYTYAMPENETTLVVDFEKLPDCNVRIQAEHGDVWYTNAHRAPFFGEAVHFTFTADTGYRIEQVLVNGNPVVLSENGQYTYESADGDIEIAVSYAAVDDESSDQNPGETQKRSGFFGAIIDFFENLFNMIKSWFQ